MKIEQHVIIKIIDRIKDCEDLYDYDGIESYADADAITAAEEGFLKGYLDA